MDPVTLGLCTQIALDGEVAKAAKWAPAPQELPAEDPTAEDTLRPAIETQDFEQRPEPAAEFDSISAADVFANFGKSDQDEDEESKPS